MMRAVIGHWATTRERVMGESVAALWCHLSLDSFYSIVRDFLCDCAIFFVCVCCVWTLAGKIPHLNSLLLLILDRPFYTHTLTEQPQGGGERFPTNTQRDNLAMSIEVHVRVRPGIENSVWATAETVIHNTANPKSRFVFHKVHPTTSSNTTLFRGMEALVHAAFEGKHVTIMAYGQTGSGKTHSMLGVADDLGVVPRAAKLLLDLVHVHQTSSSKGVLVTLSVTEIYNDTVRDLLDPMCRELQVKDGADNTVTTDSRAVPVNSFSEFLQVSNQALGNRKTGVTNMNEHSSRSHMVLTLEIHRGSRVSSISLVDLAGSESASRANTKGVQLQEGGHINQSLLSLGNVVNAIVEGRAHVPYRESKLTRILRHCLGGNGLTFILCCVNPAKDNQEQTNASLQFAQRAMKIKNDPVTVINCPPLFTHQFAASIEAALGGEEAKEIAKSAYARGLYDAYHHCVDTTGSILLHSNQHVSAALNAMANAQRALLASDQVCGAQVLSDLQQELTRATDALAAIASTRTAEGKRARENDLSLEARRSKVSRLEQHLEERNRTLDCEVGHWEYELFEAKRHQIHEMDVAIAEEQATRWMLLREYWTEASAMWKYTIQTLNELMDEECEHRSASLLSSTSSHIHHSAVGGSAHQSIILVEEDDEIFESDCTTNPTSRISDGRHGTIHSQSLLPPTAPRSAARRWLSAYRMPAGLSAQARVQFLQSTLQKVNSDVEDMQAAVEMIEDELPIGANMEHSCLSDAGLEHRIQVLEDEERALKAQLVAASRVASEQRVRAAATVPSPVMAPAPSFSRHPHGTSTTPTRKEQLPSSRVRERDAHVSTPKAAAAAERPSTRPSTTSPSTTNAPGYVSPYSQKVLALRSPTNANRVPPSFNNNSSNGSATTKPPACAAAEKVALIGQEVHNAMALLKEARQKLLQKSPTHKPVAKPCAAVETVCEMDPGSTASASSPLKAVVNASDAPNSTTTVVSSSPSACNTDENAVVGIAARRKVEQQPQRAAVERTLFYLSLSPQLELGLHKGTKVTPQRRAATRSKS